MPKLLFVRPNIYYNVSNGVGRGRKNDYLDVLMVQFFLNIAVGETDLPFISPPLKPDGDYGSKTREAIKKFQDSWNRTIAGKRMKNGSIIPSVATDGIVSSAQGVVYSGRTWTIVALNILLDRLNILGSNWYQLHNHKDCPGKLKDFFASSHVYFKTVVLP